MFPLSSHGERVVEACRKRHLLSPIAESRVRQLCQRGLSLEQALVGMQLISIVQYGEAVSDVCGWPYAGEISVDDPSAFETVIPSALRTQHQLHPLFQEGADIAIAFAHPDNESSLSMIRRHLRVQNLRVRPYVMLHADARRLARGAVPTIRLGAWVRGYVHHAREESMSHLCFSVKDQQVVVDGDDRRLSVGENRCAVPDALFPALVLYLRRMVEGEDWLIEPMSEGKQEMRLVRKEHQDHFFHVTETADLLLRGANVGLTIMIDADAYTRHTVAEHSNTDLLQPLWQKTVESVEEGEAIYHAILAGSVGTVFLTTRLYKETRPLWHALREADIPIRSVRIHHLPSGETAWESFPNLV